MGICISVGSSEIQVADFGQENAVYHEKTKAQNSEVKRVGSVFSFPGSKGLNQDAAILYQGYGMEEDMVFCGVFDGHGKNGHVVSKFVRNRLPSLLLNQMNPLAKSYSANERVDGQVLQSKSFQKWKEACVNGFMVMDKEIKVMEDCDCTCSGASAVVVIRQSEDLIISNLGDSRAVLGTIRADGGIMAVQLTTDLKPGLPGESERIRKHDGRVFALKEEPHIQRVWLPNEDAPGLAMSRSFGDFLLKSHGIIAIPDVSHHRLSSSDQFLVLASDGVWDVLSNDEVVSLVRAAGGTEETVAAAAASAVVEAATAAWRKKYPSSARDDCSVVCLFFMKHK